MPLNDNGRNACLTGGLGNVADHVAAHTAIPNAAGNAEATGGSYAREAITWGSAASGARVNSGEILIDVAAGTYVALGFWSDLTVGTHYGHSPLNSTKKGFGTATTADVVTSNGHGLSDTEQIVVYNVFAESLPTGLTEGTVYFVRDATTDTFKLALTSGGTAIDITAVGELYWQDCIPETFAAAGQLRIADGALALDVTGI